jgi:inward rectifier potassium channel
MQNPDDEILKEEAKAAEDSGFGQKFVGGGRLITEEGSYNIERKNVVGNSFYEYMIGLNWLNFFGITLAGFLFINMIFATAFVIIGVEDLNITKVSPLQDFFNCLYFSIQTFTSVGYGHYNPTGNASNIIASINAFTGLFSFALATGILFARFSRPRVNILFSDKILLTPFQDGLSLQCRLVNANKNVLLQMQSSASFTWIEKDDNGNMRRKFNRLKLELDFIYLFPLNWTLVHKIDENSPFFNKSYDDIKSMTGEVLVFVRGFDDTYGDYIYKNKSYMIDQLESNKVFLPMYKSIDGKNVLDISTINDVNEV